MSIQRIIEWSLSILLGVLVLMGLAFAQLLIAVMFPVSTQQTLVVMDELYYKCIMLMMSTPFRPAVLEAYRVSVIIDQDPESFFKLYIFFILAYMIIGTIFVLLIWKNIERNGE